jgi:hypothetical protein
MHENGCTEAWEQASFLEKAANLSACTTGSLPMASLRFLE